MSDELPLHGFFEKLCQNDFPLGIDDYERLLRALKLSHGLGIVEFNLVHEAFLRRYLPASDFETLKQSILRICKLLWLKPDQSTQLFEDLFNGAFNLDSASFESTHKVPSPPEIVTTNKQSQSLDFQVPAIQSPRPTPEVGNVQESIGLQESEASSDGPIRVRIDLGSKSGDGLSFGAEEVEIDKNKFLFTENYFPIDRRKVQQNLRAYPSFRNFFSTTEIDLNATVDHTLRRGFFEKAIYQQLRLSTAQFIFLIDAGDSMVAFRQLAKLIRDELETAFNSRETPGEEVTARYFNLKSSRNVYSDRACTKATELTTMISRLDAKAATIIIFSDGGAAASTNDRQIVNVANDMIRKLNLRTRKIVWINPLPKDRWTDTAAEKIHETVVMFEANESGIKGAIDSLRGASVKILKSA